MQLRSFKLLKLRRAHDLFLVRLHRASMHGTINKRTGASTLSCWSAYDLVLHSKLTLNKHDFAVCDSCNAFLSRTNTLMLGATCMPLFALIRT